MQSSNRCTKLILFLLLTSSAVQASWESFKKNHSLILTLKVGAASKTRYAQLRLEDLIEDGQTNEDGDTYNTITTENFATRTPESAEIFESTVGVIQRQLDTGAEKYNYLVIGISEPYQKCFNFLCSADYTCLNVTLVRTAPADDEESDIATAWQSSPYDDVSVNMKHKPKQYNKLQIALLAIGARAYLYYHKTSKGLAHLWRHLTFSCSSQKK